MGPLTKKLSLYADDALLYPPDASDSLVAALEIIDQFGSFSGIRINWAKSLLFPLSQSVSSPTVQTPLTWVSKFWYLGIEVQRDHSLYMVDNVYPILQKLTSKCQAWKSLPLSPVGRINLLKITFLPKFLYLFCNTPVPIPSNFFNKLDQIGVNFIWARFIPRVAKAFLQMPLSPGGLAFPCFRQNCWAAVMVTVRWCFTQSHTNPTVNLGGDHSGVVFCFLVFRGLRAHPEMTILMRSTVRMWAQMSAAISDLNKISPHTPL